MPKKVCIRLSPQERRSLQHRYKVEKHPKLKERYQMLLLSDNGKSVGEVAEVVGKSIWTVSDMLHAYEKRKLAGIQVKPQPGNHRKLTREQRKEITSLLKRTPRHSGIDVPFWNIHALHTLLKQKFSVVYAAPDSYRALLYESGFSFHRPEKKYLEQDPVAVKKWLIGAKKTENPEKAARSHSRGGRSILILSIYAFFHLAAQG